MYLRNFSDFWHDALATDKEVSTPTTETEIRDRESLNDKKNKNIYFIPYYYTRTSLN